MRNIFVTSKPGFYFNLVIAVLNLALFVCFGHWYNAVAGGINMLAMYGTNPYRKQEKPVLEYDNRWSDPDYIAMIHRTRKEEADNDLPLSECKCSACLAPKRVETSPRTTALPSRKPEYFDSGQLDQMQKESESSVRYVDDIPFAVPSFVPVNANAETVRSGDGNLVSAYFWWYDLTGKKFGLRVAKIDGSLISTGIITTNEIRAGHVSYKNDRIGELPPGWEVY